MRGGLKTARRLRTDAIDALERLSGRRDPLVPPRSLIEEIGGGDYVAIGDRFFDLFLRAGLEPADDVLDVGCGAGRMARPLAGWLRGSYEGFDVSESAVRWCRRRITPRHPNFGFTRLDVANDVYNPGGRLSAAELRFPYGDDSFDFAFLTSVFTHMLPEGVLRYLDELARVLRPGGRVLATYFLLDPAAERALERSDARIEFPDSADGALGRYRLANRDSPASAVAYPLAAIEAAHAERGLAIRERWPGRWSGAERPPAFQDVTVSVVG